MLPLPTLVLSGFLGAGKTTLLQHVLNNREGLRVAVIVNDMSEINIDSQLVMQGGDLRRTEEKLVEMTNGCICCTLREDLLQEVSRLARDGRFDYLLIESTGISEPMPVAATFTFTDEDGACLGELARLDNMVTVVDASTFREMMGSTDDLRDRRVGAEEANDRGLAELLLDQVEFANVLVLNKTDLVGREELQALEALLRQLNPMARVLRAERGRVDLHELLHTGRFDMEAAQASAGWTRELNGEHTPETLEYGIASFVYEARRPFHPRRLEALTDGGFPNVMRGKGFVWLASVPDDLILLSIAGKTLTVEPQAQWLAAEAGSAEEAVREQGGDPDTVDYVKRVWREPYGDRRQELVFIGQGMDREALVRSLDAALLTEAEMAGGPQAWVQRYGADDPFAELFPERQALGMFA